MFRPLEAIIRSRFGYPGEDDGFGWPLATQTHLPLQDIRIVTWWWPPEAETCRLIIKIPYISCNKLFSNSRLVFNLNYYKFVVLDVHTLLFSIPPWRSRAESSSTVFSPAASNRRKLKSCNCTLVGLHEDMDCHKCRMFYRHLLLIYKRKKFPLFRMSQQTFSDHLQSAPDLIGVMQHSMAR